MKQDLEIEPSEDLAYWVGVAQSDGCLTRYTKKDDVRSQLIIGVCQKSLPMLERFREISRKLLDRDSKIWRIRKERIFHIGIKSLLEKFRESGIILSPLFIPPIWTIGKPRYFGAYLAGLIDGDGDIRIKRPKYPQCQIRICTGIWQEILQKQLVAIGLSTSQYKRHQEKFVKSLGRIIKGSWIELEFGVTKKSRIFIQDYVVPQITLIYKKEKLLSFIEKKYAPVGI